MLTAAYNERMHVAGPCEPDFMSLSYSSMCRDLIGFRCLLQIPGLVNVDFADVRTIMTNAGTSLMGQGRASGKGRAREAALQVSRLTLMLTRPSNCHRDCRLGTRCHGHGCLSVCRRAPTWLPTI